MASGALGNDGELAWHGLCKLRRGQKPGKDELRAIQRAQRELREELAWEIYESIPKRHWRQMSGRQDKVLNEQAARYGLPLAGSTISLPNLARSIHDMLARYAPMLAGLNGAGDPLLVGGAGDSPALERYRLARAKGEELTLLERQGELLRREIVHAELGRLAALLRAAGEQLDREFGPDAAQVINDTLDAFERTSGERLGGAVAEELRD